MYATFRTHAFDSRPDWLAFRRRGIGGSDSPAIFGESRFKGPLEVWADKSGRAVEDDDDLSPSAKRGIFLEDGVGRWFAEESGRPIGTTNDWLGLAPSAHLTLQSEATPWLLATPDRICREAPDMPGAGAVQIKTANTRVAGEWVEDPPLSAQIQLQHELCVTGLAWGAIVLHDTGSDAVRWWDVLRNDGFIEAALIPRLAAFWNTVVSGERPNADPVDPSIYRALYPIGTEESAEVPAELVREYAQLSEEIAAAEKRKKEVAATIQGLLCEASIGTVGGRTAVTWKNQRAPIMQKVGERETRVFRLAKAGKEI